MVEDIFVREKLYVAKFKALAEYVHNHGMGYTQMSEQCIEARLKLVHLEADYNKLREELSKKVHVMNDISDTYDAFNPLSILLENTKAGDYKKRYIQLEGADEREWLDKMHELTGAIELRKKRSLAVFSIHFTGYHHPSTPSLNMLELVSWSATRHQRLFLT